MFKKSAVPMTIHVALAFTMEIEDPDTGEVYEDDATVVHHFNRPKPSVRERLAEKLGTGRVRGGRVLKETYNFWKSHIISVDGYDELMEEVEVGTGKDKSKVLRTKDKGNNYWDNYFADAIGQEHVQSAVVTLLNKMGAQETDYIKKSDSSQEE